MKQEPAGDAPDEGNDGEDAVDGDDGKEWPFVPLPVGLTFLLAECLLLL